MFQLRIIFVIGLLFASLGAGTATAQLTAESSDAEHQKFFENNIRPVLVRECYGCHSSQSGQAKGGLLLDTRESSRAGGDSGAAVEPGLPEDSLLIMAIEHDGLRMPPGRKLPRNVSEDFRTWVDTGAWDPREQKIETVKSTISQQDIEQGRRFWSFQPPKMPAFPLIQDSNWPVSEIDRFVLAAMEQRSLKPVGDAEANTLLRRLVLDLTGLPASRELESGFASRWASDPQGAIEYAADQLLADPGFGERWGRHWLDVARYAESTGRETNATYPQAWRYRDYVIDSFNDDRPYDEFLRQQIAGDLLPVKRGPDAKEQFSENLIATGFLALGPKTLREANGRQFDLDLVDEQIDVLGNVVLGVSIACARCHDHKFEPIPQSDYYAIAGIFQSTKTLYGTTSSRANRRPESLISLPITDSRDTSSGISTAKRAELQKQLEALEAKVAEVSRSRAQARRSSDADEFQRVQRELTRLTTAVGAAAAQLNQYDENGNALALCMGVQDGKEISDARLLVRGEFDKPSTIVPRGVPQVLTDEPIAIPRDKSGRRELANWITDRDNPLTARVMVNRVWGHLMGRGIVDSMENFGSTGSAPTHPELLDYLAVQFMENNWSIKTLIREIVTSRIYRLDSEIDLANHEADPDNIWLWRHKPRRLDAEVLRDCMLAISGNLDRSRPDKSLVGRTGPGVVNDGMINSALNALPILTAGIMDDSDNASMIDTMRTMRQNARSGRSPRVSIDGNFNERSVYLPVVRDSVIRPLEVFDFADPNRPVGQREESNTPDQGLYLLNNSFVVQQSGELANRLMEQADGKNDRIKLGFELVYGRPATRQEIRAAQKCYSSLKERSEQKSLAAFCQGLFASAEFRYSQ